MNSISLCGGQALTENLSIHENTVIKSLESLGVNLQRIIKDAGYFMWNILLPMPEDCIKVSCCDLIIKDLIFWTEYEGRHRTRVVVFEVPAQVIGCVLFAVWRHTGCLL